MPCLMLSCPIVVGGTWLIRDPWPWMLVRILAAFVPVHGFLPEASGFLLGSFGPTWVGAMADVHIPLIESLSQSVMRWVSAPGYTLSLHACLIVCRVMSAHTFMAAMLAMLSQRAEVPDGDG
jgi:hypothetical protein